MEVYGQKCLLSLLLKASQFYFYLHHLIITMATMYKTRRCLNITDTDQVMLGQPAITLFDFYHLDDISDPAIDNFPKIDW